MYGKRYKVYFRNIVLFWLPGIEKGLHITTTTGAGRIVRPVSLYLIWLYSSSLTLLARLHLRLHLWLLTLSPSSCATDLPAGLKTLFGVRFPLRNQLHGSIGDYFMRYVHQGLQSLLS
jgi:hypothetical protein